MKNRLSSIYSNNLEKYVLVQVIETDGEVTAVRLPLDLVETVAEEITKNGQAPILFGDNTYINAQAIILGSNDFWKTKRLIVTGGGGY